MTLPLLWFLFRLSWAPLSLVYPERSWSWRPSTHIYVNSTEGRNSLFWGLLSNHHINQSGKKKSYCFHKDSARVEQQVLARHHPHTHPLRNLPLVHQEVAVEMGVLNAEDFQVRRDLWGHLVLKHKETSRNASVQIFSPEILVLLLGGGA